ncbi:(2Fe-2S)-binding protein [candidate division KSB1 bacterium 4572_119]|nr:MAG: (2Fe-2S)-binding protein [candidate division KSB1 bacterium 4572_119]
MVTHFFVNGKKIKLNVSPKKRLLDILRDDLGLTGTKEGCGKGECGACTVLMDEKRVNSCLIPALQLENKQIVTVEGIKDWSVYKSIERTYIENGAVQCGFCISGFVMSTLSLLKNHSTPVTTDQIKKSMGGNLCRCTGYSRIIKAIQELSNNEKVIQKINKDWRNEFSR